MLTTDAREQDDSRRGPDSHGAASANASQAPTRWFYVPAAVIYGSCSSSRPSFVLLRAHPVDLRHRVHRLRQLRPFFTESRLLQGLHNTLIFGVLTSALKVVLGLLLARAADLRHLGRGYLRAVVFFPVLVSTIGVGITFKVLMDPFDGIINKTLAVVRHPRAGLAHRSRRSRSTRSPSSTSGRASDWPP